MKKAVAKEMPEQILVIRWSGLGDIVMTLPALDWLKRCLPQCRITYLTDTAFGAIPRASGLADSVITIDRRGFQTRKRFAAAALGLIAAVYRLRRQKIEAALDWQGFGETAVLALLSGARLRAGRVKGSALRQRIYHCNVTANWETQHRSRYFEEAAAQALGMERPLCQAAPSLATALPAREHGHGPVGLNIGASTESRRWSEKNFFALAEGLAEKGLDVRFFLGPQEGFLREKVDGICRTRGWTVACHRRLEPLMDDLARCRLVVSNDTGPGHLAAALGIPVLTLFSTGDPDNVRPLAPRARWFRDAGDINRIRVDAVLSASLDLAGTQSR